MRVDAVAQELVLFFARDRAREPIRDILLTDTLSPQSGFGAAPLQLGYYGVWLVLGNYGAIWCCCAGWRSLGTARRYATSKVRHAWRASLPGADCFRPSGPTSASAAKSALVASHAMLGLGRGVSSRVR